jgi:hypothetical protein
VACALSPAASDDRRRGSARRHRDAAATALPDWDPALKGFLYDAQFRVKKNSADERRLLAGFAVASLAEGHDCGPSIRLRWAPAKALGLSEPDAWRHVMAWSVRRPRAWQMVEEPAALVEWREPEIRWRDDNDPDHPLRQASTTPCCGCGSTIFPTSPYTPC